MTDPYATSAGDPYATVGSGDPYAPVSSGATSAGATTSGASSIGDSVVHQQDDRRSIGELLGRVTGDLSTLMRQEVALAKAEASQSASRAGRGIGMLAGAATAAIFVLAFLSTALWWGIGNATGRGWAGLIVAAIWLVIAIVLGVIGKKELDKIRGLPDTADTVGKIPNALKGQEEKNL